MALIISNSNEIECESVHWSSHRESEQKSVRKWLAPVALIKAKDKDRAEYLIVLCKICP